MSFRTKVLLWALLTLGQFRHSLGDDRAVIPLFVESDPPTQISTLIPSNPDAIRLDAGRLLSALTSWLEPSSLEKLRAQTLREGNLGWLTLESLRSVGLEARFDPSTVELKLAIPPALRKTSTVSLFGASTPRLFEPRLATSRISGFLNLNAAQDFQFGSGPESQRGREPFRGELDGAMNLGGWVLEGTARVREKSAPLVTRGDVRLVHDDPSRTTRYSLGDLYYPTTGFQRYRPLLGAAAVTQFSLQPYRVFSPAGGHEIFLKSRSTVQVFLNGRPVHRIELPPGRHDLRDLPFSVGANEVRYEITDDIGRSESITLPYVFSDQLLAPGVHELSYALGAPAELKENGSRRYLGGLFTAHLAHRYGLSQSTTLGGFAEGDRNQVALGASLTTTTGLGTFGLEPAASFSRKLGRGLGARLSYVLADYHGPESSLRNLGLALEATDPRFVPLTSSTTNPSWLDAQASYSQQISKGLSLNLSLRQAFVRGGGTGARTLSAGLARSWDSGLNANLTANRVSRPGQAGSLSAFFLLSWSFPEKSQTLSALYASENQRSRMEWSYNPSRSLTGSQLSGTVEHTRVQNGFDLRADHAGNRARVGLSQSSSLAVDGSSDQHRTQFRLASALVFADGAVALGRPVLDSFVIVKPVKNLQGETVLVNPQDDPIEELSDSRNGWFGPAVLPELVSYRYIPVRVQSPGAKPGREISKENYMAFPTYKSGTLLELGTDATVLVRGSLLNLDGSKLPLVSGELRSLDRPGEIPVVLFTNREGRFTLEGMKPGRYELVLFDETPRKAVLEIPPGSQGVLSGVILKLQAGR